MPFARLGPAILTYHIWQVDAIREARTRQDNVTVARTRQDNVTRTNAVRKIQRNYRIYQHSKAANNSALASLLTQLP